MIKCVHEADPNSLHADSPNNNNNNYNASLAFKATDVLHQHVLVKFNDKVAQKCVDKCPQSDHQCLEPCVKEEIIAILSVDDPADYIDDIIIVNPIDISKIIEDNFNDIYTQLKKAYTSLSCFEYKNLCQSNLEEQCKDAVIDCVKLNGIHTISHFGKIPANPVI